MKVIALFTLLALSAGRALASDAKVEMQDKTITKVVKLLQGMLDKSVKEGDEERKIFAKFKCYCDQNEAEKKATIKDNTQTISTLESKIEELQGSNGERSSKCAELKSDMADNKASRDDATSVREKENKAFTGEKADLTQAIGQMKDAIETLTKVGADQTASTGADNKQFMAGKASLMSLQSTVHTALKSAEAFMSEKQYSSFTSFLQAPFTGTYTSQSGAVMGIIKSMRDTFKANLATAISNEESQLASYDEFMKEKNSAFKQMEDLYDEAQGNLGDNDQDLSSKRKQLSEAEKSKTEAEDFLDNLLPMCKAKSDDYAHRKTMRASEEVAVSQAISILNSDEAFATFGGASATSTGALKAASFLQVSRNAPDTDVRDVVQRLLKRAAAETGHHAPRLAPVIAQLQAENPFDTVLDEIDKMIDVIDEEGKADKEKKSWCDSERTENHANLKSKKAEILRLEGKINMLDETIDQPKTGLKKQIADTETALLENAASQKTETEERAESNVAYVADVKNLAAAKSLMENAIKVLKAYYDQIDAGFLQQMEGDSRKPPATWEGDYKGQSDKGGDVIGMLQFILKETEQEETDANTAEETSVTEFDKSMTALKKEQGKKEESLTNLQDDLAEKEQDRLTAKEDLKVTTKDKEAVEETLSSIKPGCDFITTNFDLRNKNRKTEKTGLQKAMGMLKGSPAYKNAEADATEESYGACKKPCMKNVKHVKCKACMADVTIPGYCAGHKGTTGCSDASL